MRAAGALLQYLQETQKDGLPQIAGLRTYSTGEFMTLDEATRRNLELTESIRGRHGAGLAARRAGRDADAHGRAAAAPLAGPAAAERRGAQAAPRRASTAWHGGRARRAELRELLRGLGDLERWTNRCVQGIALPRDLVGMREALGRGSRADRSALARRRSDVPSHAARPLPRPRRASSGRPSPTTRPPRWRTAGVIRPGFSAELDGIHLATRDAKTWIANLESVERARTGIKSLKVGYNKVFGYYIEVTQANAALVPADYIRKQTLVNAERYITPELKEYESLVLNAEERILELEGQLYRQVLAQIAAAAAPAAAHGAAGSPSSTSPPALAEVAEANRYVRPDRCADDAGSSTSAGGRHPVVETHAA